MPRQTPTAAPQPDRVLLDTNILLRLANAAAPTHAVVRDAVLKLDAAGHQLCVVPQCAYEYVAVATRPVGVNGLGVDPYTAAAEVSTWPTRFTLLPDDLDVFRSWLALLGTHPSPGKKSPDARLAAAMIRHGVGRVLTFNGKDFARYPIVTAVDPNAV